MNDVYLGCAFPEAEQGMNIGRVAAMRAGLPIEVPGQTINRFCSSGLQTIALAAERVMCGFADCIVAGGVESMSCVPLGGLKYSANPGMMVDWPEAFSSMGITAELVAERMASTVLAMDTFAAASNAKAAAAIEAGRFTDEIIPVEIEKDMPGRRQDAKKSRNWSPSMTGSGPVRPSKAWPRLRPGLQSWRPGNRRQLVADDRWRGCCPGGLGRIS